MSMLKGAKAVSAPRSTTISKRRTPVSGGRMLAAVAKMPSSDRVALGRREFSLRPLDGRRFGRLAGCARGVREGSARGNVIRGAMERLADAIAGQVDWPAGDLDFSLLVIFDFHLLHAFAVCAAPRSTDAPTRLPHSVQEPS